MIDNLPTIKQLLKQLQQVPYLASKNTYHVAEHFLEMDQEKLQQFVNAILNAKLHVSKCSLCWSWKENNRDCVLCGDLKRDFSKICVVETWQDLLALEKTGGYQGLYHVLGGAISPLDGLTPDDLTINQLVERVKTQKYTEIILALNQTPEGEVTSAFIARKLQSSSILISCLARGIPVGSILETMDRITVYKALTERRPF